jgi:hypothetical protein
MKVFIWTRIANLTDNYHSDGGLVVVADNLADATFLAENEGVTFAQEEINTFIEYNTDDSAEEKVFIFPDAGCC